MKLGLCYQSIGKLTDAEKSFGLAVQLNPANVQGWIMCSIVQSLQGRFWDAESTANKVFPTPFRKTKKWIAVWPFYRR